MRPNPLLDLLKSINLQTHYPDEILIVDGSLNNETEQLLSRHDFKNLKYFKVSKENKGLTKQRNYGISLVSKNSEIVCFLDDDTTLDVNYFKEICLTYKEQPNAIAVGGYIVNEVDWEKAILPLKKNTYEIDGWTRNEGSRFLLRKKFKLVDNTKPGFMPSFSHGRPISFLPPSGKVYETELLMGGAASYKADVFDKIKFSSFFEGYGLYEDADFSLRLSKLGGLYINTNAKLNHYHDDEGRPNRYKYGKMVIRNGWYVWRIKYPKPTLKSRLKWNLTAFVLTVVRMTNVVTTNKRKEAFTESIGRIVGWCSLIINKPKPHV